MDDDDHSNKDNKAILKLKRKINKLKFENEINFNGKNNRRLTSIIEGEDCR